MIGSVLSPGANRSPLTANTVSRRSRKAYEAGVVQTGCCDALIRAGVASDGAGRRHHQAEQEQDGLYRRPAPKRSRQKRRTRAYLR